MNLKSLQSNSIKLNQTQSNSIKNLMEQRLQINHLIDNKGAIPRIDLADHAQSHTDLIFCTAFRAPFLVGSLVLKGSLLESRMIGHETMNFQLNDDEGGTSLGSAIYPIMKRDLGYILRGYFTLGRTQKCDMVMNDFSISREHAKFEIEEDRFFVTDLGSTNGTWVNETELQPHTRTPLPLESDIAFGRYKFTLMSPKNLYECLIEA
jgi:hypothetical protein